MEDRDAIRDLMAKLMAAVEASLSGSRAVREALAELVRHGYEARLFFVANGEPADGQADGPADGKDRENEGWQSSAAAGDGDEEETLVLREIGAVDDDSDLEFELTKLDRDFLKSLNIRPETG